MALQSQKLKHKKKTSQNRNIKEQIFERSIQLFLHKGYKSTTIYDITNATNITKGAFYWHFRSKDELLQNIVDYFEATFIDLIIKKTKDCQGNFLTKMKYLHKMMTEFAYQRRDLCLCFLTLSAEMIGSGTEIEKNFKAIHAKYRNFLKELLKLGKEEGYIKPDFDLTLLASVLYAFHNGALLEWYFNYNEIDGALFARMYRDVSFYGILKDDKNI